MAIKFVVYAMDVKNVFYVFYSCHVFTILTFLKKFFNVFIIKTLAKNSTRNHFE